jgi:hypothetical protein
MHTNRIKDITVEQLLEDEFIVLSTGKYLILLKDSDGGIAIWRVSKEHSILEG